VVRLRSDVGFLGKLRYFLAEPRRLLSWWPLPTIDQGTSSFHPFGAALIDLGL
jgi:hypothetical protein